MPFQSRGRKHILIEPTEAETLFLVGGGPTAHGLFELETQPFLPILEAPPRPPAFCTKHHTFLNYGWHHFDSTNRSLMFGFEQEGGGAWPQEAKSRARTTTGVQPIRLSTTALSYNHLGIVKSKTDLCSSLLQIQRTNTPKTN